MNDRAALLEAANALIESEDALDLYKKLKWVYEVANRGLPVRLVGHPAVLNPLLELMLEDFPAAERVLILVDAKREEAGIEKLKVFDRNAYMRELMAKKRERQIRMANIYNMVRLDNEKLVGQARLDFMNMHANRWHAVRLEREEEERQRLGRRLTEVERKAVIDKLWQDVDNELDDYEHCLVNNSTEALARHPFEFRVIPKEQK